MRQPAKKISTKARLDAMIERIPEADRTATISAALKGLGGSLHVTAMEICPVCGQDKLPTEYRHGIRRCRNCPHYENENASQEARNESMNDTRNWMLVHGKAVA